MDFKQHYNIDIPEDNLIIDRSKIRRERKKSSNQLEHLLFGNTNVWRLFFDGRKDKTLINEKNVQSNSYHKKIVTQEHVTLIKEAGSEYIGHTSPTSGHANVICDAIFDKLTEINAPLQKLFAVGCDGTVVNTGCNNDDNLIIDRSKVRRERTKSRNQLEHLLFDNTNVWGLLFDGRKDQTLINEKNVQSNSYHKKIVTQEHVTLIKEAGSEYIGHTSPTSGHANVVQFERTEGQLPDIDKTQLSTDQNYLYQIA
ncbi:hypothetical protein TSAR_007980 [Trichomalopsis sarcophagae]|uniref:Uncharacterized protein n=1 Tax=Trichomalopsis sarcophagae TaxID=543379 RepID=A0A232FN64_9HYME|nr:hypothetical protein TSAR_007980 [Trichomalopsis sarcophagae]